MNANKILLVEDNADDEFLALRAIKRQEIPVDVYVARDGQEALDHLLNKSVPLPDLVFLDLKLPKVTGLDVLKQVRADERAAEMPVIVLTSSNEERDIRASYRAGCNSYIRKPVDFNHFSRVIGQLVEYWLTVNEAPRN